MGIAQRRTTVGGGVRFHSSAHSIGLHLGIEIRKLKYFIACTIDRFIARPDDSYDFFLTEREQVADLHAAFPETIPAFFREKLGITSENQCFDAVVMGRKTYEVGLKEGISNPYPQMKQYVVSQTLRETPDSDIELV